MKKQDQNKRGIRYQTMLIVLCCSLLFFGVPKINSQTANEYTLKSVFLLRVANFVEWPEGKENNNPKKNFIISIYGDDPFNGLLLSAIASQKYTVKNKDIVIRKINNTHEIESSDILFISSSEKYNLTKILDFVRNKPILTIGDTKGFIERGVMVNMFIEDLFLKFDINLVSSKESNIYISSKLLSNAHRVIK